jgi:hypothetical protein
MQGNQLVVGDYACEITPEEQEIIFRVEEEQQQRQLDLHKKQNLE